jgi:hypothetical protein
VAGATLHREVSQHPAILITPPMLGPEGLSGLHRGATLASATMATTPNVTNVHAANQVPTRLKSSTHSRLKRNESREWQMELNVTIAIRCRQFTLSLERRVQGLRETQPPIH